MDDLLFTAGTFLAGAGAALVLVIPAGRRLRAIAEARRFQSYMDKLASLKAGCSGSEAGLRLCLLIAECCYAPHAEDPQELGRRLKQAIEAEHAAIRQPSIDRLATALPHLQHAIACLEVADPTSHRSKLLVDDARSALGAAKAALTGRLAPAAEPTDVTQCA